jgi:hypothetical protein
MAVVLESKAQVKGVEESQKLDHHYLEVLGIKYLNAMGIVVMRLNYDPQTQPHRLLADY